MTAAVIDDVIYVLGGESPAGTFTLNEAYQAKTGRWTTMAPMPTSRHGLGSAAVGHELFIMAGGPKPGGSFSNINEVFQPPLRQQAALRRIATKPTSDDTMGKSTERASSRHVGAVMAMLATFDQARVLPPEGSPQANQIIKALIQFQSAFLKSRNPAVQRFFVISQREQSESPISREEPTVTFQQTGWTTHVMEALADYSDRHHAWRDGTLEEGLREYNVNKRDFDLLVQLFHQAKATLQAQGTDIHQVYVAHRRDMPGAPM
jgi:hypothetical protein